MKYENLPWNKIKKINSILSVLIVFIHGQNLSTYGIKSGFCFWIENCITLGMARVAVPFFFFLSGMKTYFTLDRNLSLHENWGRGKRKLVSRIKTLLLPYLIWITITWLGTVSPMITPIIKDHINGTSSLSPSLESLLITLLTGNGTHLWFLNRLIILSVFMPLIFMLMKDKLIAKITMVLLIILSSFFSNDNVDWIRIILFYLAGIYATFYQLPKENIISREISTILFFAFSAINTVVLLFSTMLQIEIALLFFIMMSLYGALNDDASSIKDRSFWVYLSHGIVLG